jgi:hypothetical protein
MVDRAGDALRVDRKRFPQLRREMPHQRRVLCGSVGEQRFDALAVRDVHTFTVVPRGAEAFTAAIRVRLAAVSEVGNGAQRCGADEVVSVTASIAEPAAGPFGPLRPVRRKWPWIVGGLALQLVGIGAPVVYVLDKAKHKNVGGSLTRATVRFAWHEAIHSHAGLALLIARAVGFAIGAVLLARPFAKSWLTLLVAVPIAAVAGLLVLGAAALVVGLAVAGLEGLFDGWGGGGSRGGGSSTSGSSGDWVGPGDSGFDRSKRRRQQEPGVADGPFTG